LLGAVGRTPRRGTSSAREEPGLRSARRAARGPGARSARPRRPRGRWAAARRVRDATNRKLGAPAARAGARTSDLHARDWAHINVLAWGRRRSSAAEDQERRPELCPTCWCRSPGLVALPWAADERSRVPCRRGARTGAQGEGVSHTPALRGALQAASIVRGAPPGDGKARLKSRAVLARSQCARGCAKRAGASWPVAGLAPTPTPLLLAANRLRVDAMPARWPGLRRLLGDGLPYGERGAFSTGGRGGSVANAPNGDVEQGRCTRCTCRGRLP
jgi:hypothetical protein